MKARWDHDPEADAAYVTFGDGALGKAEHLDDARHVDRASDGSVLGVELLNVSRGVDTAGLPHRDVIERLLQKRGVRAIV